MPKMFFFNRLVTPHMYSVAPCRGLTPRLGTTAPENVGIEHYCTMLHYRPLMDDDNALRALLSPLQMATPQMILSFTGEVETAQCPGSIE